MGRCLGQSVFLGLEDGILVRIVEAGRVDLVDLELEDLRLSGSLVGVAAEPVRLAQ